MSKLSVTIGSMLCLLALFTFTIAGFAREAWTALIPLFVGLPIALCGLLTDKFPAKRKITMHIAVVLAFLGFAASASRIPKLGEFTSIKSISVWVMCLLCFLLLGAFIQSFVKARMPKA
jgi:hypothetical protein